MNARRWLLKVYNTLYIPHAHFKQWVFRTFFLHVLPGWYEFIIPNRDQKFIEQGLFLAGTQKGENCYETFMGSTIE